MDKNELMISWLNSAYEMEKSIEQTLRGHTSDAKDNRQLHDSIMTHVDETRMQAEMIKNRIEQLGGSTSAIKSGASQMMGMLQGFRD
ncbi:DUF892 family protein [Candidatus Woesearchaeota archaeon]|nr:DUF892 family protein [Candidatus Woesearchaeota archaeon]